MDKLPISNIIIGIISGVTVALLIWLIKTINSKIDTHKIIIFLQKSKATTKHTFRSNHAISSATNLSEERVRTLCSKSTQIKRNEKQKESWQLQTKKKAESES